MALKDYFQLNFEKGVMLMTSFVLSFMAYLVINDHLQVHCRGLIGGFNISLCGMYFFYAAAIFFKIAAILTFAYIIIGTIVSRKSEW